MAKHGTIGITYSRRSYVFSKEHGSSVQRQDNELEASCRKDQLQAEHYSDAKGHRSGKSDKHRPEYRRAIARITDPSVHTIYFDLLDRAWRNVEEWNRMLRMCRQHDVIVKLISQNIIISSEIDPFQKAFLDQMASFAEFESNVASYRQKKEVANKKAHLVYWGGTPFGSLRVGKGLDAKMCRRRSAYQLVAREDGSSRYEEIHSAVVVDGVATLNGIRLEHALVIDHAATVNRMFTIWSSGVSFERTALQLNSEGYKHLNRQNELVPFRPGAIQTIVWNPLFYAGYVVVTRKWHSKLCKVKLEGEGTLLERLACAYGAVRSPNIEPIITDEVACHAIQARMGRRRTGRSLVDPRALLTPIVEAHDGRRLHANTIGETLMYRTRSAPNWMTPALVVDEDLLSLLDGIVFPEPLRQELIKMRVGDDLGAERVRLNEQLSELYARIERIEHLYEDGFIKSREEARTRRARVETELSAIQTRLNAPDSVGQLIESLTQLGQTLRRISIYRRKRALQELFQRIRLNEQGQLAVIEPAPWARDAFGTLLGAIRKVVQICPRQDLNQDLYKLWRLQALMQPEEISQ